MTLVQLLFFPSVNYILVIHFVHLPLMVAILSFWVVNHLNCVDSFTIYVISMYVCIHVYTCFILYVRIKNEEKKTFLALCQFRSLLVVLIRITCVNATSYFSMGLTICCGWSCCFVLLFFFDTPLKMINKSSLPVTSPLSKISISKLLKAVLHKFFNVFAHQKFMLVVWW